MLKTTENSNRKKLIPFTLRNNSKTKIQLNKDIARN